MEDRWARLEEWIETSAPAFSSTLRPPATPADVDAAEADLGVSFPRSVRQSYLVHDGENGASDGVLGYRLLTLAELTERAAKLREIDDGFDYEFWSDSLVPLMEVVNGDYLCVSDATDAAETPLVRWDHERSARTELAPSFAAYFDAVLDALEAGRYDYDETTERLTVDVEFDETRSSGSR